MYDELPDLLAPGRVASGSSPAIMATCGSKSPVCICDPSVFGALQQNWLVGSPRMELTPYGALWLKGVSCTESDSGTEKAKAGLI
jgi:hypothetical protein